MVIERITARDLDGVVNTHLAAFPSFFLSVLGPAFLREFYRAFVRTADGIGHVARSADGQVIGVVVGAVNPAGFYRRLLRRRWFRFGLSAVPAIARDPRRVARVLRAISHPNRHPRTETSAGLFSIAVDPRTQGIGTGHALLAAFIQDILQTDARAIYLTTDSDANDAVNQFYVRAGFTLCRQFVTPEGRRMNEYELVLSRFADTR